MPRRKQWKKIGLCPSYGLWPMNIGAKPEPGAKPQLECFPTARHSLASHPAAEPQRNLTSGGRAVASKTSGAEQWQARHPAQSSGKRNIRRRAVPSQTSGGRGAARHSHPAAAKDL